MSVITDPVAAKLAGDATLAALIGTFAGVPAIFTSRPIPDGAIAPFIITEGNIADVGADTLRRLGRQITRDISVWFPASDDPSNLETAAERIRTLFHKTTLAVTGHHHVMTLASGPIPAPDSGDERGRVVTIQVLVQEG